MKTLAKLLTALMLGVMVILGVGTLTVKAAGWEAPTWGDLSKAEIKWNVPDDYKNYDVIKFSLFRDGEVFNTSYIFTKYMNSSNRSITMNLGSDIDQSGSYTMKVAGCALIENGSAVEPKIESPFSKAYDYVLPETRLATPSNLRWEAKYKYIYAVFDPVEGAGQYYITLYRDSKIIVQGTVGDTRLDFTDKIKELPGDYTFDVQVFPADISAYAKSEISERSAVYDPALVYDEATAHLDCKWYNEGGKSYWYEGGVRQGTYDDPKGVEGDGTIRGREIFDPATNAWYWLDANANGAKAIGKEVWMPYIYQDEKNWTDEEKRRIANESDPGMEDLVYDYMIHGTGKWVRYDKDGKMLKGWVFIVKDLAEEYPDQENNVYYYDTRTGLMAKGYLTIEGADLHFDEITGALDRVNGEPFKLVV